MSDKEKIQQALDVIFQYGGVDGAHHKVWVLEQVTRLLTDNYDEWVAKAKAGEDGPNTYSY